MPDRRKHPPGRRQKTAERKTPPPAKSPSTTPQKNDLDARLDEALEESFPASDSVSVSRDEANDD